MIKHISSPINGILSSIVRKGTGYIPKIMMNWEEIVGENISNFSSPIKIYKKSDITILYIAISNSSVGTELHYMKPQILDKISFFIGEEIVDDIKIILKPS